MAPRGAEPIRGEHARTSKCIVCLKAFTAPKVGRPRLLCGDPKCWVQRRWMNKVARRPLQTCECQWCGYRHRTANVSTRGEGAQLDPTAAAPAPSQREG